MRVRIKRWEEYPERFRCCEAARLVVSRVGFEGMLLELAGPVVRNSWCCQHCFRVHEGVRSMVVTGSAVFDGHMVNLEVLDIEEGS